MSLARHLDRQYRQLEGFIALLESERETLTAGQVDGQRLAEQARDKQDCIEALERLETQRLMAQRKLGYVEGDQGADTAARDAGCLDAWRRFRELARHARQLNELNGALIGSRLAQNQRILDFLNRTAGQALYGPDGQSRRKSLGGITSRA